MTPCTCGHWHPLATWPDDDWTHLPTPEDDTKENPMSKPITPRDVIAQADRHRSTARAAESAMLKIRLGETPVQRRGLLGFHKREDAYREMEFTGEETGAIYEALREVRRHHEAEAARFDAMVTTTEDVTR